MDQVLKIEDKIKKSVLGQKDLIFLVFTWERKKEKKRASKPSFGDTRSFVGRNPPSQELKFIASIRATRSYQKRGISPKIQRRIFEAFEIRRCSRGFLPFLLRSKG